MAYFVNGHVANGKLLSVHPEAARACFGVGLQRLSGDVRVRSVLGEERSTSEWKGTIVRTGTVSVLTFHRT